MIFHRKLLAVAFAGATLVSCDKGTQNSTTQDAGNLTRAHDSEVISNRCEHPEGETYAKFDQYFGKSIIADDKYREVIRETISAVDSNILDYFFGSGKGVIRFTAEAATAKYCGEAKVGTSFAETEGAYSSCMRDKDDGGAEIIINTNAEAAAAAGYTSDYEGETAEFAEIRSNLVRSMMYWLSNLIGRHNMTNGQMILGRGVVRTNGEVDNSYDMDREKLFMLVMRDISASESLTLPLGYRQLIDHADFVLLEGDYAGNTYSFCTRMGLQDPTDDTKGLCTYQGADEGDWGAYRQEFSQDANGKWVIRDHDHDGASRIRIVKDMIVAEMLDSQMCSDETRSRLAELGFANDTIEHIEKMHQSTLAAVKNFQEGEGLSLMASAGASYGLYRGPGYRILRFIFAAPRAVFNWVTGRRYYGTRYYRHAHYVPGQPLRNIARGIGNGFRWLFGRR